MSPEQVEARPLDSRSDIFSFGVILYEMLAGTRAFSGSSMPATLSAILKDQPELVPGEQRVNPDHRMAGSAGIDAEARQQDLLRGGSASRHVPGIEHQAPVPGLRQVARGDQAVMPSPRHDNVRALIHGANVPGTRPAAQAAAPANRS